MTKKTKKPEAVDAHLVAVLAENGQRLDRVESTVAFNEADFLKDYRKQAPDWLAAQAVKAEVVTR